MEKLILLVYGLFKNSKIFTFIWVKCKKIVKYMYLPDPLCILRCISLFMLFHLLCVVPILHVCYKYPPNGGTSEFKVLLFLVGGFNIHIQYLPVFADI